MALPEGHYPDGADGHVPGRRGCREVVHRDPVAERNQVSEAPGGARHDRERPWCAVGLARSYERSTPHHAALGRRVRG